MESLIDLQRLETREIQFFFCDNLEVIVGDTLGQLNADLEVELSIYDKIFKCIQPHTCLDVGANIGTHTIFFSKYAKSIYSFEPNPFIYPIFKTKYWKELSFM